MSFGKISAILAFIVSMIVIYQFYQENKKKQNVNNNTMNDANKNVSITNPVLTGGAINQTASGGPAKPWQLDLVGKMGAGNSFVQPISNMHTPISVVPINTMIGVPRPDSPISEVAPIRGDLITAQQTRTVSASVSMGPMFGDNLPSPSLVQHVQLPIDIVPKLPLTVRNDAPLVAPVSVQTVVSASIEPTMVPLNQATKSIPIDPPIFSKATPTPTPVPAVRRIIPTSRMPRL